VGCLSIDAQRAGAAKELEAFKNKHRADFQTHLALCDAVLRAE